MGVSVAGLPVCGQAAPTSQLVEQEGAELAEVASQKWLPGRVRVCQQQQQVRVVQPALAGCPKLPVLAHRAQCSPARPSSLAASRAHCTQSAFDCCARSESAPKALLSRCLRLARSAIARKSPKAGRLQSSSSTANTWPARPTFEGQPLKMCTVGTPTAATASTATCAAASPDSQPRLPAPPGRLLPPQPPLHTGRRPELHALAPASSPPERHARALSSPQPAS